MAVISKNEFLNMTIVGLEFFLVSVYYVKRICLFVIMGEKGLLHSLSS